jgi:transposase
MIVQSADVKVYLASGNTDMRKSINGLSLLVEGAMGHNPLSGSLFVFCNRKRTILKLLYWDRNGFCLWQKRLEKERFKWPVNDSKTMTITNRELMWLIDGMDIMSLNKQHHFTYSRTG